jgi:hypothetical protein
MCVKNNLPVSWAVAFSLVGMKCAILLNQSTTTMIVSNPLDGGKLNPWTHFPIALQELVTIATILFVFH